MKRDDVLLTLVAISLTTFLFVVGSKIKISFRIEGDTTVIYSEPHPVDKWCMEAPPGWMGQMWLIDPCLNEIGMRLENITIYAWFPQEAENAWLYRRYVVFKERKENVEGFLLLIRPIEKYEEKNGKWTRTVYGYDNRKTHEKKEEIDVPPDWVPMPEFKLIEMENTPIGRAKVAEMKIPWITENVRMACEVLFYIPRSIVENHSYAGVMYLGKTLTGGPVDSTFFYFDYQPPVPSHLNIHLCFIDIENGNGLEGRYMNTFTDGLLRPGEWFWSSW
jgi:hypothetical protein